MDTFALKGTQLNHFEDGVWLQRIRLGDQDAIGSLIARHRSRLVRVAANILRSSTDAEDVVQDTFVKAFRELGNLRDDRAFAGYLYRITVRLCMDRLRARKIQLAEGDVPVQDEGENVENRVLVRKLLAKLPYDLRTTLVLREMEQLSYDEIAEVMSVPVGTVRSRLHAARERFREHWMRETRDA